MKWPWSVPAVQETEPTPAPPAKPRYVAWSGKWSKESLKCPSCGNVGAIGTVWNFKEHKGGPEVVRCTKLGCRVESYKPTLAAEDAAVEDYFVVRES